MLTVKVIGNTLHLLWADVWSEWGELIYSKEMQELVDRANAALEKSSKGESKALKEAKRVSRKYECECMMCEGGYYEYRTID